MYELEKIKEAEYFYSQMFKFEADSFAFKCNLSAFLSAARSILQFALKEAQRKEGGKKWYDSLVACKKLVQFFKDKRDINIHTEPVETKRKNNIDLRETISFSESIRIIDEHSNIIVESKSDIDALKENEIPPKITYRYMFDDWPGEEDILNLCRIFLDDLKAIVVDGQKRGFLSVIKDN